MASSAAGVVLGLTPLEPEPEQRGPGRIIGAPGGRSECVQADPKYMGSLESTAWRPRALHRVQQQCPTPAVGWVSHMVPLGADCQASHHLRRVKLQRRAMPFDWMLTTAGAGVAYATDCIRTNFERAYSDFRYVRDAGVGVTSDDTDSADNATLAGRVVAAAYPRSYFWHH